MYFYDDTREERLCGWARPSPHEREGLRRRGGGMDWRTPRGIDNEPGWNESIHDPCIHTYRCMMWVGYKWETMTPQTPPFKHQELDCGGSQHNAHRILAPNQTALAPDSPPTPHPRFPPKRTAAAVAGGRRDRPGPGSTPDTPLVPPPPPRVKPSAFCFLVSSRYIFFPAGLCGFDSKILL